MEPNLSKQRVFLNFFFVIILVVLLATNIFSYHQVDKVTNAHAWVKHTNQVIDYTNNVLVDLVQIESATRGYLFSKNPAFVTHIDDKISVVFRDFNAIKVLTKNNVEQQARLKELEPILIQRINDLKKQIELQNKKALELKSILPFINKSKELTVEIERRIDEIYNAEVKLLQEREDTFIWNFDLINLASNTMNIINLCFLMIIIFLLNRMLSNLIKSQEQLKNSEVIIKGIIGNAKEYIAAIDLNYNFLAFSDSFEREFREIFGKRIYVGDNLKNIPSIIPENKEKILSLWRKGLSGEEFTAIEEFALDLHLSHQYELTYSSICDTKNKLIGSAVIARNISNRVKEERKLKRFNEKLAVSFKTMELKAKEMTIINDMYNKFRGSSTIEEVLKIVVLCFKKLLPDIAGVIYLMKNSKHYLESVVEWNEPKFIENIMSPEQCWGLRQGKVFLYVNEDENILCKHFQSLPQKVCSYICVPLLALNEIIGILHLQLNFLSDDGVEKITEFYDRNHLMIQNVTSQISLSISNLKLNEILKLRSTRDVLTGLYNRTYLEDFLVKDLQRARRKKPSMAIVMMDLDHFKNINDLYGHESGDIVLKKISNFITLTLRSSDVACRYGGEEIIMVLYDISLQDALEKINELRLGISELEFQLPTLVKVTASFGLAMFPDHGQDARVLIKAADEALYVSKKSGRNRITPYNPPNKN